MISAENGKAFLSQVNISDVFNKVYPTGAEALRRQQLKEVDRDDFYEAQKENIFYQTSSYRRPSNYANIKKNFTSYIDSYSLSEK